MIFRFMAALPFAGHIGFQATYVPRSSQSRGTATVPAEVFVLGAAPSSRPSRKTQRRRTARARKTKPTTIFPPGLSARRAHAGRSHGRRAGRPRPAAQSDCEISQHNARPPMDHCNTQARIRLVDCRRFAGRRDSVEIVRAEARNGFNRVGGLTQLVNS